MNAKSFARLSKDKRVSTVTPDTPTQRGESNHPENVPQENRPHECPEKQRKNTENHQSRSRYDAPRVRDTPLHEVKAYKLPLGDNARVEHHVNTRMKGKLSGISSIQF